MEYWEIWLLKKKPHHTKFSLLGLIDQLLLKHDSENEERKTIVWLNGYRIASNCIPKIGMQQYENQWKKKYQTHS